MEYKEDDLNDEKTLERALQLLYGACLGESGLRARLSIHINYDYLQSALGREANQEMESLAADITKFLPEDHEVSEYPRRRT